MRAEGRMQTEYSSSDFAKRLLGYLREITNAASLTYAQAPAQIIGGYDTRIFAFQLANAPPSLSGPLILRLFAEDDDPSRARWEGVVHTAVVRLGYPAPHVLAGNSNTQPLGAAFLVMERLPGRPMLQAATITAMLPQAFRFLSRYPRILAEYQARLHGADSTTLLGAVAAEGLHPSGPGEMGISRRAATVHGQLGQLTDRIERLSLEGMSAALRWLVDNRPADPESPVICHGDFHPINVLMADGAVTGVIDWSMATVGDAAYDVGNTRVLLALAPVELPAVLDALVAPIRRVVVRRYTRAYLEQRHVDIDNVPYFEALRCLMELEWVAERRAAGAGSYRNPWGGPHAVKRLISHFKETTGVAPALPPG